MIDDGRRLAMAEVQELGGRVSGPDEWRARRAELGVLVKPSYDGELVSASSALTDLQLSVRCLAL